MPSSMTRRRPTFEGLESRDLMAALVLGGPTPSPSFDTSPTPLPSFPQGLAPDLALVPQFQARAFSPTASGHSPYSAKVALDAPTALTTTSPTTAEVARQYFVAKFQGTYTIGPGRFQGQSLTIHAVSRDQGGSNQFLKGKAQILFLTPSDPTSAPTTGLVSLFAQNYLQSGNLVIIDVGRTNQSGESNPISNGGPTTYQTVNGLSLPTQMPWAFDQTSAGAYTAPAQFNRGGGQLSVTYTPDRNPRGGNLGSGKVTFLLQGLIDTSSILNVVDKGIN